LEAVSSPARPAGYRARHGALPFLGRACGTSVAAIYYNRPLLLEISRTFRVSQGAGAGRGRRRTETLARAVMRKPIQ